jgi:hypothetical protein
MAQFTVEIPDDLLPAIEAEYLAVSTGGGTSAATAAEYFEASCVESVRQRAEIYQVGSYYKGAVTIEPRFLADGRGNPNYTGPDAVPYVVVYPSNNGVTVDPDTGEETAVPWADGDQWTDPVTDVVYEYSVDEEGNGSWGPPTPAEEEVV